MKGEIYTGSLDLIVTHYKEPWSTGKKLFDMLALQRDINFDDVGVILVNDGEENELVGGWTKQYPFDICQMSIPHGGVSKARNAGLDASEADYVMFCDFDDTFLSALSLHLIVCGMEEDKWDVIRGSFMEETRDDDGMMHLVPHDDDTVFIHGKVFRRQFLVDNNLRFDDRLRIHEDGYFNALVYAVVDKERDTTIKTPIYLWSWNDDSVVRKDRRADYVLDTYDHLMKQRIALTDALIERQMADATLLTVIKTVCDSYYDFQQHTWRLPKNKSKVERAERWFCSYLKRFAKFYATANVMQIGQVAALSRARVLMQKTMLMESQTIKEWLDHIMNDVRPIPMDEQGV